MSRKSQDNSSTSEMTWAAAAEYAEERVREARLRLAEVESALAICIDRRDRGEPFPVERTSSKTEDRIAA